MQVFFYVTEGSADEQKLLNGFRCPTGLIPKFHFTTEDALIENLRSMHKERKGSVFYVKTPDAYRQLIVEGRIEGEPNGNGAYPVIPERLLGYYRPTKDRMESFATPRVLEYDWTPE